MAGAGWSWGVRGSFQQCCSSVESTESVQVGEALKHSINSSGNTRNMSILDFFRTFSPLNSCLPKPDTAQSRSDAPSAQAISYQFNCSVKISRDSYLPWRGTTSFIHLLTACHGRHHCSGPAH